ncbi:cell division protein FtsZ [Niastella koreensis]|uniref:Cell division protein FtsZ n=2 Tax=Niastella koreensis TaxID=354356 RepID=G8TCT7_NIAKG|nr:cell division protein FtsZ [Niastella koreensis]AEW03541.1 cell division protein FtsZ [Niastella koreensis GR20-10]OQP53900.1 cell division protein FtsZ [Niastella koreensis]
MIHFDLPKEKSSILKVIGVGGGGSNAVNHMYSQQIEGVNFIICNTDAQAIARSQVPNKVQLGPHLTQGLGAGANPEIGRQATEESLEELKRILEVNTKMAFITAGMGGGTGTGGAPIIAKICKDLGILTVGIVTTPFSYEGPKRQAQAENGIRQLKQSVDTLLVISNDKLRHQFGNLKMKDAFSKADNVLSTAARCITDVINSTGQINVDFADVCTIMRNGGVAILGSAQTRGEDRAIRCIEEALNSPLLNDNDIRGAKWILININSSEGDHEFTMDEVEIIQNYLLSQAGEDTDVILGMGYDNTLGDKIGITLIATGFEHKDPFKKATPVVEPKKDEKILLSLNQQPEKPKKQQPVVEQQGEKGDLEIKPELAPRLVDGDATVTEPTMELYTQEEVGKNTVDKNETPERIEWVLSQPSDPVPTTQQQAQKNQNNSSVSAASGGYLAKPSNIYAEPKTNESKPEQLPVKEPVRNTSAKPVQEDDDSNDLHLVFKDDISATDVPGAYHSQPPVSGGNISAEDLAMLDEAEEQKRRAAERIQKLRNLSFNINGADPNNEFETVPAYIRRNLELYNTFSSVENFYSKYEVKTDENNNTQISTLNTFLDGKKPD